jgi:hypothetical protein
LHHAVYQEEEYAKVGQPKNGHQGVDSDMEQKWRARVRPLIHLTRRLQEKQFVSIHTTKPSSRPHPFYSIGEKPMEAFREEKDSKHQGEGDPELVTKYRECQ